MEQRAEAEILRRREEKIAEALVEEEAALAPALTQEEVVMVLRFLTEPDRLQLHGHETRSHVALVDKLIAIARSLGVTINEGTG